MIEAEGNPEQVDVLLRIDNVEIDVLILTSNRRKLSSFYHFSARERAKYTELITQIGILGLF